MRALNSLLQTVQAALARRAPRERIALIAMACTIAIALWAQLLWSAHHERARYTKLIGELQVQNGAMRQARDAMNIARAQGGAIRSLTAERALTVFGDSLRLAGMPSVAVSPHAPGQVRLAGNAGFDNWLGWLAKTQAEYGVQVLRVGVERSEQSGQVKIEAIVALAGAG
jgi:type II secretory pathway component PulM